MSQPTQEELYRALEKADAAGDVEAARELAAMIREYNYQPGAVSEVEVPPSENAPLRANVNLLPPDQRRPDIVEAGRFVVGSLARGLAGGVELVDDLTGGAAVDPNTEAGRVYEESRKKALQIPLRLLGLEDTAPTTAGGRILDTAIQGAAGGLVGPGGIVRNMLTGAAAGAGAQSGVESAAHFDAPPAGRLAAGLAGGLAGGGLVHGLGSISPKPVEEILAGSVEDAEAVRLSAAKAKRAREQGVSANTLDYLTGPKSKLQDVEQATILTGQAENISRNIRQQSEGIQRIGNELVERLPGEVVSPRQAANRIQQAATDIFKENQANATAAFQAEIDAARNARLMRDTADLQRTTGELGDALQTQAAVREGVAPMLAEERQAAQDWLKAEFGKLNDQQRLELARAGREVSNETAFNVDELGNWGTLIMARQALGGGDKRTWTAAQLRERGVDDELIGAMMQKRQPTMGFETRQADPKKVLSLKVDNPGGDWLDSKKRRAALERNENPRSPVNRNRLNGATTATAEVRVPTELLRGLKGASDEMPAPGSAKYDRLAKSVAENGWQQEGKIMVFVNEEGVPFIWEGNNRTKIAFEKGVPEVDVEIQWINGSEVIPGEWNPQTLANRVSGQQPLTSSTGAINPSPQAHTTPTPTREGNVARAIQKHADADVADAEQALATIQSRIAGNDLIPPSARAEVLSDLRKLYSRKRGDQGFEQDLQWIVDGFSRVRTSQELHNFIRSIQDDLPSVRAINAKPADLGENSVLGSAIGSLKRARNAATPAYADADKAYKAWKDKRAGLYDETTLGKLATRGGSITEADAAEQTFFNLLRKGESPAIPAGSSDLRKTLVELAKNDPAGLQTAFRTYLDQVMVEAFGKGKTGRPSERPGEALTTALGDSSNPLNDARLHGLKIAAEVLAKTTRMTSSQRLALTRGLDNLREIANANARTFQFPQATTPGELRNFAKDAGVLNALRLVGVNPGSVFVQNFSTRLSRKTLQKLDELFSNPDKVEQLIALGQQPKLDRRKAAFVASLIGTAMADRPPQEPQDLEQNR